MCLQELADLGLCRVIKELADLGLCRVIQELADLGLCRVIGIKCLSILGEN